MSETTTTASESPRAPGLLGAREAAGERFRFRGDIEGLRAIAVVAVILFHVGAPFFSGGYVGVDVFFVISGFLITSQMLELRTGHHRMSLSDFYARRVRRILPLSTLVIVATLVASRIALPPLQQTRVAADGRAAALFVSNIRFAIQDTDYFATASARSPFQHFWSLSVEEQFYVVWPALLMGLLWLAARATRKSRAARSLPALFGIGLVVVSFAISVVLTRVSQPLAFFLITSRAWELGVGALLCFGAAMWSRVPKRAAMVVGWCGLVAIGLAIRTFTESSPFPGWIAAIPVLGTASLVVVGMGDQDRWAPSRLLSLAPAQWIGRHSYSLYLWHWPVLVIARELAPKTFGPWRNALLLVVLVTVPLSMLSYRWVEQPVRRSDRLRSNRRVTLLVGIALVAVAVLASAPFWTTGELSTNQTAAAVPTGADPRAHPTPYVPNNLVPSLEQARSDRSVAVIDGCNVQRGSSTSESSCVYGDPNGSREVVLFGDSHAEEWTTVLDEVARQNGWKLTVLTKSACTSYFDETKWSDDVQACDQWRKRAIERIAADRPDVVILSNRSDVDYAAGSGGWTAQMRRALGELPAGPRVVVLGETAVAAQDVPACLSANLNDPRTCAPDPRAVELSSLVDAQRQVSTEAGATFVDMRSWLCNEDSCPTIVGDTLSYRDDDHVTTAFSRLLRPKFESLLTPLVTGRPA